MSGFVTVRISNREGNTCFLCGQPFAPNEHIYFVKHFYKNPQDGKSFHWVPSHEKCAQDLSDEIEMLR